MNSELPQKTIIGEFDTEGIFVYQAYNKQIAEEALSLQRFGKKFKLTRFSWIKPSFGWMLYRSGYASKASQEIILKIKLSHQNFHKILEAAVPTTQDLNIYKSGKQWREKHKEAEVRYQWDPDRDSQLGKLERRAIQLGLQGEILENYARKWIIEINDVTSLAYRVQREPDNQKLWPDEREYKVSEDIMRKLGMINSTMLN